MYVPDEKFLNFRARKIAKQLNISIEEALEKAMQEALDDESARKIATKEKFKALSKKVNPQKVKPKKTEYTVNGKIVSSVVSGGLPSLGKRSK